MKVFDACLGFSNASSLRMDLGYVGILVNSIAFCVTVLGSTKIFTSWQTVFDVYPVYAGLTYPIYRLLLFIFEPEGITNVAIRRFVSDGVGPFIWLVLLLPSSLLILGLYTLVSRQVEMPGVDGFIVMWERFLGGKDKEALFISGTSVSANTNKEFNSISVNTLIVNFCLMSLMLGFILAIIFLVWGYCHVKISIINNPKSVTRIFSRNIRVYGRNLKVRGIDGLHPSITDSETEEMTIFSKSPFYGNQKVSNRLLNGEAKNQFANGEIPFFRADFGNPDNRIERDEQTTKLMDELDRKLKEK